MTPDLNRAMDPASAWGVERNVLLAAVLAGSLALPYAARGAPSAAGAPVPGRGKVVARVNGEAIYQSQIAPVGMTGSFEIDAEAQETEKLERMIALVEIRQFLAAHQFRVTDADVDKMVEDMRKNPPSMGCPCCRYPSLGVYLRLNAMTMADLREMVRNELGISRYVLSLWAKKFGSGPRREALLAQQRTEIEKDYTHAWQIFFNTFQRPDTSREPAAAVAARAKTQAEAAWARLRNGEPFAAVAKQVSEDQISRPKGGDLGFTSRTTYGKEFEETLKQLKPGEISHPFVTPYGYHIVKWMPVGDKDLAVIARLDYTARESAQLLEQINKKARVEKYTLKTGQP